MMPSVLAVHDMSITIGSKEILHDIDFRVGPGEFVGIIGSNGVGKSSLLRCLRGFLSPTGGHVEIFGERIATMKDKTLARKVAYMQQEVNVTFGFTGLEVVLAGRYPYLKWWQNERQEDQKIARNYMHFTGVEHLAHTPVNCMSGGERQRVLLAKVLAQETPLIFLDEPTASLDLVYQEEIFRYCQLMCQQGKTILIVAHDLKLAAKFCSRLILLADEGVIADGPPENVITEENLQAAYGLHAAVFMNMVTGNLDIHTYAGTTQSSEPKGTVHIIGGGGAGGSIMRLLYENGYRLTIGVLQPSDTDAHIAEAFGISCILSQPFCGIDASAVQENRTQVIKADWVVLANLCYGKQNIDNLQVAFEAKRLIIIEETTIEERDYSGGQATELYKELCTRSNVEVMTYAQFVQRIEKSCCRI